MKFRWFFASQETRRRKKIVKVCDFWLCEWMNVGLTDICKISVCLHAEEKKRKNEELMRVLIKVISIYFPIMQQSLPVRQLEITTAYHSISEQSLLSTGHSQFDAQMWNCIPNTRRTLEGKRRGFWRASLLIIFRLTNLNPSFLHQQLTSIRQKKLANNRWFKRQRRHRLSCYAFLFDVGTSINSSCVCFSKGTLG